MNEPVIARDDLRSAGASSPADRYRGIWHMRERMREWSAAELNESFRSWEEFEERLRHQAIREHTPRFSKGWWHKHWLRWHWELLAAWGATTPVRTKHRTTLRLLALLAVFDLGVLCGVHLAHHHVAPESDRYVEVRP